MSLDPMEDLKDLAELELLMLGRGTKSSFDEQLRKADEEHALANDRCAGDEEAEADVDDEFYNGFGEDFGS